MGIDATCFETDINCDLAITSPPYVNALDYIRCTKFESSWLGLSSEHSRAELRRLLVGEPTRIHVNSTPVYGSAELSSVLSAIAGKDPDRARTVQAYVDDLVKNLHSVGKALKRGGTYWIIVGENEIRGVRVSTHLILANIAPQMGFNPTHLFRYVLRDHRTSIPRKGRGGKIDYEYVLGLTKLA